MATAYGRSLPLPQYTARGCGGWERGTLGHHHGPSEPPPAPNLGRRCKEPLASRLRSVRHSLGELGVSGLNRARSSERRAWCARLKQSKILLLCGRGELGVSSLNRARSSKRRAWCARLKQSKILSYSAAVTTTVNFFLLEDLPRLSQQAS